MAISEPVLRSFDLKLVIFDDRIAQQLVARVVDLFAGAFLVAREFDLQVFAHMHGLNAGVAHLFERVLDRLPLGIEDGLLRRDNNFCFHTGSDRSRKTRAMFAGKA